jgi:hypothetical protein
MLESIYIKLNMFVKTVSCVLSTVACSYCILENEIITSPDQLQLADKLFHDEWVMSFIYLN